VLVANVKFGWYALTRGMVVLVANVKFGWYALTRGMVVLVVSVKFEGSGPLVL